MPDTYRGFTVPAYPDTADAPVAFKALVDSILDQLPRGVVAYAQGSGDVTVGTSTGAVLEVTATLQSGRYYVAVFNGFFRGDGATGMESWFLKDGSPIGTAALSAAATDLPVTATSERFTATAGSHTIMLQHRHVSGGGPASRYTGGGGGDLNLLVLDVGPA